MKKSKSKGTWIDEIAIKRAIKYNQLNNETSKNLSTLNVNRGGKFGGKGFVGEHMAVYEMNKNLVKIGLKAEVINNNGLADIVVKKANGTVIKKYQAKFGYENKTINVSKYVADKQIILVNKDASKKLIKNLKSQGAKIEKSDITTTKAENLSRAMRTEGKILKNKNSTVVVNGYKFTEGIKNCHKSGINSARKGAAFGGGFSLSTNTIDIISGKKEIGEALVDITTDTAIATGTGYIAGATLTALGSTTTGAAIGTTISAASATVTSTAIGGAIISGGATASATISAGATAILGTGAIATAVAISSPVIVVGMTLGVVGSIFRSIFD